MMSNEVIFSTNDDKSDEPNRGSDMDVIVIKEQELVESSADQTCGEQMTQKNIAIEEKSSDNIKQIIEMSGNFVLIFNKQNSTLIKKSYNKIDKNVETIISTIKVKPNICEKVSVKETSVGSSPLTVDQNPSIVAINNKSVIRVFIELINEKMAKKIANVNENSNERPDLINKTLNSQTFKPSEDVSNILANFQTKSPYKCDQNGCGKQYKTSHGLKSHIKNHHNNNSRVEPFSWEWPKSDAVFKLKAPLEYRCDYCSKTYVLKAFYEKHLKNKH